MKQQRHQDLVEQHAWMLDQARRHAKSIAAKLNEVASLGGSRAYTSVREASRDLAQALLDLWPQGHAPTQVLYLAKSLGLTVLDPDDDEDRVGFVEEWDRAWIARKVNEELALTPSPPPASERRAQFDPEADAQTLEAPQRRRNPFAS